MGCDLYVIRLFCCSCCQTPGYGFSPGIDFVLPLSQQEEQQEQEPSPKPIRRGSARRLKFGT